MSPEAKKPNRKKRVAVEQGALYLVRSGFVDQRLDGLSLNYIVQMRGPAFHVEGKSRTTHYYQGVELGQIRDGEPTWYTSDAIRKVTVPDSHIGQPFAAWVQERAAKAEQREAIDAKWRLMDATSGERILAALRFLRDATLTLETANDNGTYVHGWREADMHLRDAALRRLRNIPGWSQEAHVTLRRSDLLALADSLIDRGLEPPAFGPWFIDPTGTVKRQVFDGDNKPSGFQFLDGDYTSLFPPRTS